MADAVPVSELLKYLEETKEHFATTGEQLNEGAARVLRKLREHEPGKTVRRTYIRVPGEGYAMWDLLTEDELTRRGYVDTEGDVYHLSGFPRVRTDRISYWKSEKEQGDDLWVGEPLAD